MRLLTLAFASLMLSFVSPCLAQDSPKDSGTVISAETLEQRGSVLHGVGSVVVESGGRTIRAGSVLYDTSTGEIVAEDGVSFEDQKAEITASKAEINLETETGVLYDAEVLFKEEGYRFYGKKIEKTAPNRYHLETGELTTCAGPVPDWCVRGRDVDVIIGERVKSKDSTFRVRDVPILYTPYFWAPIVTERTTGLLLPETGYSNQKGLTWKQPFFWAISENRDATFILDAYSRRGLGFGAEYRYIETPGIRGSANFFHIRDTELHRSFNEVRAEHRHRAGAFRGFYDITYVSEKDFYREYEPYLVQSSQRFLESQAEVSVRGGPVKLFADARYLRELNDSENQKAVVQKLPEAGLFVNPVRLGPVVLTAEAAAANFERDAGAEGRRYDGLLTLRNSVGTGPTFSQRLGLGYTYYDLDGMPAGADPTFDRGHISYSAEVRTSLARVYGNTEHIVLPALFYEYRRFERGVPPLFDSKELLSDLSEAGISFTNRLIDRKGEFLNVRLRQAYDFLPEDDNFKPLELDLRLERVLSLVLGLDYDWNSGSVTESHSSLSLRYKKLEASGGHTYTKGDITMYNAALSYEATPSVTLRSSAWYDATGGNLERLGLGILYKAQCWSMALDYTRRPDEHIFFLTLGLKGFGDM